MDVTNNVIVFMDVTNNVIVVSVICGTVIICLGVILYTWKKVIDSTNKSKERQLELNTLHEMTMKKVEWEQKMEWEDRIANKEKETIVRNYIDTLWNKRHVICEKDLKALGLLSFVYKDLDFDGRIEKLVKELTEQKLS